ncbi:MAG: GIY-YIG nuclease family protein [Gammaproteobacteria bacterium]
MTNRENGTLYTGVTSDLAARVYRHKSGETGGFVKKHGAMMLIYFESHGDMASAIGREKQIKKWRRLWKLELINNMNPAWRDLYNDIV